MVICLVRHNEKFWFAPGQFYLHPAGRIRGVNLEVSGAHVPAEHFLPDTLPEFVIADPADKLG